MQRLGVDRVVADGDEVPARSVRLIGLCRQPRRCRTERQRHEKRDAASAHPQSNVRDVDDRILAAVMPAPRQPVEIREFPRPDLPAGSALLRTARAEVCGTDVHLWHGRLAGVPYPIIPGHVSAGTLDGDPRAARRGSTARTLREGDRAVFFDVHRTCGRCRACTVHRTPTRCPRAASTASPIRPPKDCSAAGRRRSISSPASAWRGCPTPSRSTTTSAAAAAC